MKDTLLGSVPPAAEGLDDMTGLIVPVVTPFSADGCVDEGAYERHLGFLAERGVRRVLINGTTGEFFSLVQGERRRLLELARRRLPAPLRVLYQVGCCSLPATLEETRVAADSGADAAVCIAPYYLAHVPQAGLIAYYQAVADACRLPLILYNFPQHTQNPIGPEVLAAVPHFGMKDSSADLSLVGLAGRYYIGGDRRIVACFGAGGHGWVSGLSNAFPELHVSMERAMLASDADRADELQQRISDLCERLAGPEEIIHAKVALDRRLGGYPIAVRPPIVGAAKAHLERVAAALGRFVP